MSKKVCGIPNCNKPHRSLGMCANHYDEWYQDHNPKETRTKRAKAARRNSTVQDRIEVHAEERDGHLIWTGSIHNGIPYTQPSKLVPKTNMRASIWISILGREIPNRKVVDVLPTCPEGCVSPDHLILRDNQASENMAKAREAKSA